MQNFREDALLVQEIYSFIHSFIHSWFIKKVFLASIPHRLFLLAPNLPVNYPLHCNFSLISGDLRGGSDKNKLLKNTM